MKTPASGPDNKDALAGLGPRIWAPPDDVVKRIRRTRRTNMQIGMVFRLLVLFPGILAFSFFLIIGDPLLLVSAAVMLGIFLYTLPEEGFVVRVPFGVYKKGVVTPNSFQNTLGMQKFGGQALIMRSEIAHSERVEEGDYIAIVVYTEFGGGIVGPKMTAVRLSQETLRAVVDGFEAALAEIGVATKPATGAPLGGPEAPSSSAGEATTRSAAEE